MATLCDRCKTAEGFLRRVHTWSFDIFSPDGFGIDLCGPCLKAVEAYAFGKGA